MVLFSLTIMSRNVNCVLFISLVNLRLGHKLLRIVLNSSRFSRDLVQIRKQSLRYLFHVSSMSSKCHAIVLFNYLHIFSYNNEFAKLEQIASPLLSLEFGSSFFHCKGMYCFCEQGWPHLVEIASLCFMTQYFIAVIPKQCGMCVYKFVTSKLANCELGSVVLNWCDRKLMSSHMKLSVWLHIGFKIMSLSL